MKKVLLFQVMLLLFLFKGEISAQDNMIKVITPGNSIQTTGSPDGAFNPLTLTQVWSYQLQPLSTRMEYGASPAIMNLGAGVNQVGGEPDNYLELVTGSDEYDNFFPELNSRSFGIWRCFDALGNLEWAVDTKSDESRTSVAIADIDSDLNPELATGTTSGWCIEVMNKFGSWTPGASDAAWTFPYEPQRSGSFMWHSSPAVGELISGVNHAGLEVVAGNNPLSSIWAFDGDNTDGINDGDSVDLTSWGYPGPTGTEGVDWDVLWVFQTNGSIIASPAIGDIDGNGSNEVICGSKDSILYCLNGATGALIWSYQTAGMITSSAGLADFDNNGKLEVVVGSHDGLVYFIKGDLNGDGVINPAEVTWFTTGGAVYSSPAIADVNNDGILDVIIGSDDYKIYCLQYSPATNSVTSSWSYLTGNVVPSSPAIANSGRPTLTIYAGSVDSVLYLLNGDGTLITSYPANGQIVTSLAVADIDGDTKLEIAFTTWGDPDKFIVLRDPGSNVAAFSVPWPMFRHDSRHTGLYNWAPPVFTTDVGVTDILEPEGSLLMGVVITPRVTVYNFGTNPAVTFSVVFEIRNDSNILIYTSTQTVNNLASHTSLEVSFPILTATPGHFHTKAYTILTGDLEDDNDKKEGSYQVVQAQWILDFEADNGGFEPLQFPGRWEWGVPTSGPMTAHSGVKLWATNLAGDYENLANWELSSGFFLSSQNHPVLSFWQWYDMEDNRDGGNVKISLDGINWALVFPEETYPGIATWDNTGIPDQPCFNGLSGGWKLTSFMLPVNSGEFFWIKWHLGSDNMTTRPGWYIDDVMGFGFNQAILVTATAEPILCQGDSTTVSVSASGGTPPYNGTGMFTVASGTHTFSVTDSNGVTGSTTIVVNDPLPFTATISSVATPCVGGTSTVSVVVSGGNPPYTFLWNTGSTTQSNSNSQPGTYSVTVTDMNGCITTGSMITIVEPPTSVTIAPSANPVVSGSQVTITATPVNGGNSQSYQWMINGIILATNAPVISCFPVNNDVIFCVMTTGDGCIDTSNIVIMLVNGGAGIIYVQNIVIDNGETECYDEIPIIIVAGNGTTFMVHQGGTANMIATQKIQYLPGTTVETGGYMHGFITTTNQKCGAKQASNLTGVNADDVSVEITDSFFKLYPNPTSGIFIIEKTREKSLGKLVVDVFSMVGEKLLTLEISDDTKNEVHFSEFPVGIYFVKIVGMNFRETIKLVKTK